MEKYNAYRVTRKHNYFKEIPWIKCLKIYNINPIKRITGVTFYYYSISTYSIDCQIRNKGTNDQKKQFQNETEID